MGGLVSNENMGCVALTYSLLAMLNRISNRIKCDFDYIIFEYDQDYSENKFDELRQYFKLSRNQIQYAPIGYYDLNNPKLFLKKARINFKTLHDIKRCDVVIDITQGDSFSDIYGEERFFRLSNIKYVA